MSDLSQGAGASQAAGRALNVWIAGTMDEVIRAAATGLVSAIVTNPTVIAQWTGDGRALGEVAEAVCRATDLPLFIQFHGPDQETFIEEAHALRAISAQILPKLPPTPDGLAAAHRLEAEGIPTLVTAICSVNQAYLAAAAGASYICPYFGRVNAGGGDAQALIRDIAALYARSGARTRIIPASLHTPEDVTACLLAGADGAIVFYPLFKAVFHNPVTKDSLERFEVEDWSRIPYLFAKRRLP